MRLDVKARVAQMGGRSVGAPLSSVAHLPPDLLVLSVGLWRNLSSAGDRKQQRRIRRNDRHDRDVVAYRTFMLCLLYLPSRRETLGWKSDHSEAPMDEQ